LSPTEAAYRKTGVEGTSGLSLLIALYDTLAGDLRRAAAAERNNEIAKRCKEVNHALLVIGYLENWLARGSGGELADQLAALYASMRLKLIEAQAKRSAPLLEEQMALVLQVREGWQAIELKAAQTAAEIIPPVKAHRSSGASPTNAERRRLSWSA
jgi:flagellar secretion chaperone FliS